MTTPTSIHLQADYTIGSIQAYDLGAKRVRVKRIDRDELFACPDDQGGFTMMRGTVEFTYFDVEEFAREEGVCSLHYAEMNWTLAD